MHYAQPPLKYVPAYDEDGDKRYDVGHTHDGHAVQ